MRMLQSFHSRSIVSTSLLLFWCGAMLVGCYGEKQLPPVHLPRRLIFDQYPYLSQDIESVSRQVDLDEAEGEDDLYLVSVRSQFFSQGLYRFDHGRLVSISLPRGGCTRRKSSVDSAIRICSATYGSARTEPVYEDSVLTITRYYWYPDSSSIAILDVSGVRHLPDRPPDRYDLEFLLTYRSAKE